VQSSDATREKQINKKIKGQITKQIDRQKYPTFKNDRRSRIRKKEKGAS
jgi:hypothetical protein